MELEDFCAGRKRILLVETTPGILRREDTHRGLRVSPSGGGNGVAAIVVTAASIANNKPGRIRDRRLVAVMRGFPDATCMRRLL